MALNSLAVTNLAVKGMEAGFDAMSEFLGTVNTEYASDYQNKNVDTGQTIEIVLPARPNPWVEGKQMNPGATEQERVSLTVIQYNTGREISHAELAVSDKRFMDTIVKPDTEGGVLMAEKQSLQNILTQPSMAYVDSVGVRPASASVWQSAASRLRQMRPPPGANRTCAILDEETMAALANNESTLFRPGELVDVAALEGRVQELARVGKMYGSPNVQSHTNGDGVTTGVVVNGAGQSGGTLICDGGNNNATWTAGSQFYFSAAGVGNALDPIKTQTNKEEYTFPQVFTLTQDAVSDGSGNVTLTFAPDIVLSGSLQNMKAAPPDNTAVTFLGNPSKKYRQNILYSREAAAFVGLPLPALQGQGGVVKNSKFKEVPIRSVFFTDWKGGDMLLRYDLFFGIAVKRWEWMWRIWDLEQDA